MLSNQSLSISKGKSVKRLRYGLKNTGGRSNTGKISVYHRGGGISRIYRILDYVRFV